MIVLANIDSKIWNIDLKTVEIISQIQKTGRLKIHLNSEGPCAESLGLYRLLDSICSEFNLLKRDVTILTCNQLESHSGYNIEIKPPLYIPATQAFAQINVLYTDKLFGLDFMHFGIFIARSNWIRLWLASQIWDQYQDVSIMTYHWKSGDEFHLEHIGVDDMLCWNASTVDGIRASKFLDQCPLDLSDQNSYPILSPQHLNICKLYHRFFVEIVCETNFSGTCFYPTEKIWRPLLMKTPFIVHGSVDYLRNLRKLGFQTFDAWWSEEYDDYGHDIRIRMILDLLAKLNSLSLVDLQRMHQDMLPVLEHNYCIFMQLKESDFPVAFHYV